VKRVAIAALLCTGCATFGWRDAGRLALDVAQVACIWANYASPTDTVRIVCEIADDLHPLLDTELARARASARFAGAAAEQGRERQ
jgi:hypothetical protein